MQQEYEKPLVEIVNAEELIESVGAKAATSVTGETSPTGGPF
jgi:hypothetical protein